MKTYREILSEGKIADYAMQILDKTLDKLDKRFIEKQVKPKTSNLVRFLLSEYNTSFSDSGPRASYKVGKKYMDQITALYKTFLGVGKHMGHKTAFDDAMYEVTHKFIPNIDYNNYFFHDTIPDTKKFKKELEKQFRDIFSMKLPSWKND